MRRLALLILCASCSSPDPTTSEVTSELTFVGIDLGGSSSNQYFRRDSGGDVDVSVVTVAGRRGVRSGNGAVLPSADQNQIPDDYVQLAVADSYLFAGQPTTSVQLDITYYDVGTDAFVVQYDAVGGVFTATDPTYKTDTGTWKTATYVLKDVYWGNRDNGADFRIDDLRDGAETISTVSLARLPLARNIRVDSCGANPYDSLPDSDAIQACIDGAHDGDNIVFTSPAGSPSYQGYKIDKTIFLVSKEPVHSYLTFTSNNPADHARLVATPSLKGFVVRLFARSRVSPVPLGNVDHIHFVHLDVDGNSAARTCMGSDGIQNGVDDNWGAWLPECSVTDDSWCSAGGVAMVGSRDVDGQDYKVHPDWWSMGLTVGDVRISNIECGTALNLIGAASRISKVTVTTAGDHVHKPGCAESEIDGDLLGDWSDGFTVMGPSLTIDNNTVIDPSDVGIVFFGGRDLALTKNQVRVTAGNHGAFAGIAIHPWTYGDIGGTAIVSNLVMNSGSTTCGGIHAGFDIGPHMWGGACSDYDATAVGRAGCVVEPAPPLGALCPTTGTCQKWAYVPPGSKVTMANNNSVQNGIGYLIEGIDLGGGFVDSGNIASNWSNTDWEAAVTGCDGVTWGPTAKIAHHPARPGYADLRVHCER